MKSITEQHCECPRCCWDGTVGEAEANNQGDLVCPICWARVVVETLEQK